MVTEALTALLRADAAPAEWAASGGPIPYPAAIAAMEARVEAIRCGQTAELVWLLEHPPLYTAGARAKPEDLLDPDRLPVFKTGRGGELTYHGPGQRVAYVLLDLATRGQDVRRYVRGLEAWLIAALADLGVRAETRAGRVGVWVARGGGREDKVAAIGVRVRRWVSYHGVALNAAPDLAHFNGIVPCGVREHGVTSLADLGATASLADVDAALRAAFEKVFGPTADAPAPL
jgi:lipoyl(octanoyl) transferase